MTTNPDDLLEIQKLIWQAVALNHDNPLGYKLLDAHFAAIQALIAQAEIDALQHLEYAREQAKGPDRFISEYITKQAQLRAAEGGDNASS